MFEKKSENPQKILELLLETLPALRPSPALRAGASVAVKKAFFH